MERDRGCVAALPTGRATGWEETAPFPDPRLRRRLCLHDRLRLGRGRPRDAGGACQWLRRRLQGRLDNRSGRDGLSGLRLGPRFGLSGFFGHRFGLYQRRLRRRREWWSFHGRTMDGSRPGLGELRGDEGNGDWISFYFFRNGGARATVSEPGRPSAYACPPIIPNCSNNVDCALHAKRNGAFMTLAASADYYFNYETNYRNRSSIDQNSCLQHVESPDFYVQ